MLRILLAIIGFLVAPIVATFTYILVKQSYFSEPCRSYVDTTFAIETIEAYLRKPSSMAFRQGLEPEIIEIEEIGNFAAEKGPDERAYRFRLIGVRSNNLPTARVDACGWFEFAGYLSGN